MPNHVPLPKPAPHRRVKNRTVSKRRAAKRRKIVAHEISHKDRVRERDRNRCRWPGCETPYYRVEVAHVEDKGMGGDPKGLRTQADKMICLCWHHHQGRKSLHSGHLFIVTDAFWGTATGCYFGEKDLSYQRGKQS